MSAKEGNIMSEVQNIKFQLKLKYSIHSFRMKLNIVIFLGLFFSTRLLVAQIDFKPGFIIKTSNDTLYGEIDYRGDLLMSKVCRFKYSDNSIKEYYPNDIQAYKFIEGKYYVSKDINGKKWFLECLIKGMLNIYYMRDNEKDHYYLDKENVKLTEIPYDEGIKYIGYKQVHYKTTKHIGLLNYYTQDAPDFQSKIQSIKTPRHGNLIKLAEEYHNAVCKDEKCIIYEKVLPPITLELIIDLGLISRNYRSKEDIYAEYIRDNRNFYREIGLSFGMPRVNENMFFYIGYGFTEDLIDSSGVQYRDYRIPLIFTYQYPKYKLHPTFGYGFGFKKIGYDFAIINPLCLGLNYDLGKYTLRSNVNLDVLSLFIIPSRFWVSYDVSFGVGYKF